MYKNLAGIKSCQIFFSIVCFLTKQTINLNHNQSIKLFSNGTIVIYLKAFYLLAFG